MRLVICTCILLALAGCTGRKLELMKSPCVGAEDSPCGPKRPVNDWWLNGEEQPSAQA